MKIMVVFDMWGQRCITEFDDSSELLFENWIKIVYEKGWMIPVEVYRKDDNVVLCDEQKLRELVKEL